MSVILCTAGYDHTIRFWEALSGICSRTIQHPDSQVNRLCISPDKRFLAAAGHHTVKLYDIKSTNPNPVLNFEGHTGNITGVAFHCEGKWMVTSSEDGTVKIWETRSGTVQRTYNHGCPANDVVIHPNQGEIISCDRAGSVRVWDLAENNCSHQLIPEEDVSVSSVTVASDGSLLCAGNNAVSLPTLFPTYSFPRERNTAINDEFSDVRLDDQGNVFVWQLLQNYENTALVPVTQFSAHKEYITRILLSPDVKKLATCSADHTAKIWEVPDLASTSSAASSATLNPLSPTGGGFSNGNCAAPASNPSPPAATQNGDGIAGVPGTGGPSGSMAGLNTKPFVLEATLQGHQRWVWDCAFSADSAYLVTACSDHYARLWELHSQSIIRQYNGHHRGAVCVALNDYSDARPKFADSDDDDEKNKKTKKKKKKEKNKLDVGAKIGVHTSAKERERRRKSSKTPLYPAAPRKWAKLMAEEKRKILQETGPGAVSSDDEDEDEERRKNRGEKAAKGLNMSDDGNLSNKSGCSSGYGGNGESGRDTGEALRRDLVELAAIICHSAIASESAGGSVPIPIMKAKGKDLELTDGGRIGAARQAGAPGHGDTGMGPVPTSGRPPQPAAPVATAMADAAPRQKTRKKIAGYFRDFRRSSKEKVQQRRQEKSRSEEQDGPQDEDDKEWEAVFSDEDEEEEVQQPKKLKRDGGPDDRGEAA
ncbi:TOR complex subunit lst8 [Zalerion maritima]|uniref:Target of rapamycin complex subunit LST8 n=1 Tax=Zalerion maritima TaxID=339359 RepID=A0AAD5RWJ6_9PEZI|nr:TOR complex subunit lst8 [Zalerion maritima]